MSLTRLLKEDKLVKQLFGSIPNLAHLCKTIGYHQESFPTMINPLAPRISNSNPSLVGTAYDFWLRSYIQRLNESLVENKISLVIKEGISIIEEKNKIYKVNVSQLRNDINQIWNIRKNYITGKNVDEIKYLEGCLLLAHCESFYRSRKQNNQNVHLNIYEHDVKDLQQLIETTKQISWMFKTSKPILFNPSFSTFSNLVGGADADFTIGETIFDIKTTIKYSYNQEYIWQLIGYYLLSEYDKSFPIKINKIAIFYARFNTVIYISIDDIKHVYDLDGLSKKFYNYILNK